MIRVWNETHDEGQWFKLELIDINVDICKLVTFQPYYYYCIDNTEILTGRKLSILNILDNLADINYRERSFHYDIRANAFATIRNLAKSQIFLSAIIFTTEYTYYNASIKRPYE